MTFSEFKKHWLDGEPRVERDGNSTRVKAAHRFPSSGHEQRIAFWLIAFYGRDGLREAHHKVGKRKASTG